MSHEGSKRSPTLLLLLPLLQTPYTMADSHRWGWSWDWSGWGWGDSGQDWTAGSWGWGWGDGGQDWEGGSWQQDQRGSAPAGSAGRRGSAPAGSVGDDATINALRQDQERRQLGLTGAWDNWDVNEFNRLVAALPEAGLDAKESLGVVRQSKRHT